MFVKVAIEKMLLQSRKMHTVSTCMNVQTQTGHAEDMAP